MKDEALQGGRDTLTLEWKRPAGQPAQPAADDYVECHDVGVQQAVVVTRKQIVEEAVDEVVAFSKRMDNWRRTVRYLGSGGGGCCASWAAMYVACRAQDKNVEAEAARMPRAIVTVDQLDGWLVEAAVRAMASFEEKQALRYRYVWQYSDHWIKTKLKLRRTGVRLVLARAQRNLQQILAKLENPAKILTNNSHAGVDPRPESTDAHVGASSPLKKDEALID